MHLNRVQNTDRSTSRMVNTVAYVTYVVRFLVVEGKFGMGGSFLGPFKVLYPSTHCLHLNSTWDVNEVRQRGFNP